MTSSSSGAFWRLVLPITLLIQSTYSIPLGGQKKTHSIAVGQPLVVKLPAGATVTGWEPLDDVNIALPSWVKVHNSLLLGVPGPEELLQEKIYFKIMESGQDDRIIEVSVYPNEECDNQHWYDVPLSGTPLENVEKAIELEKASGESRVTINNFRLMTEEYASSFRQIDAVSTKPKSAPTHFLVVIPCGVDEVADVVDFAAVMEYFQSEDAELVYGKVLPNRYERKEKENEILSGMQFSTDEPDNGIEEAFTAAPKTSPRGTTESSRGTRSTTMAFGRTGSSRSTAVTLEKINAMNCFQGIVCETEISDRTFMANNALTHQFDLSVEATGETKDVEKDKVFAYATVENKHAKIRVLALNEGNLNFILKGRKNGQLVTAPFAVSVKAAHGIPGHRYDTHLDTPRYTEMIEKPKLLPELVLKMADVLKVPTSQMRVLNVCDGTEKGDSAVVAWTNASISSTDCNPTHHKVTLDKMVTTHSHHVKNKFIKDVKLIWDGHCKKEEKEEQTTVAVEKPGKKSGSKTEKEPAEGGLGFLIGIVAALALFVLLLIALVCCVSCRKQHKRSEYMTKGTPVVFPEEVDDDNADTPATAPMLVREERPPLRVSQHENPLYKPPPPLASASPRPTPTPLSASTQRLPPPYVPP